MEPINNRKIDYPLLEQRCDEMIKLLEFDSMRSPGKAKMNAPQLDSLYNNKNRYAAMNEKKTPVKKGDK